VKQVIMRQGFALVLIILTIYSGIVTYMWSEEKVKEEAMMNYAIALADIPLMELADAGSMLEYLIEHNPTDELLEERVSTYLFHARTVSYSSAMLYASTKDEKYQLFRTAMSNLKAFFITASNKPNIKELLENNLNVLKEMEEILKGTKRISELTFVDAEKILELSTELKT